MWSCTMEMAMAPHSSVLAWRIPGTGEPGGLPSMGSHRVGHDWSDLAAAAAEVVYSTRSLAWAPWWPRGMGQGWEEGSRVRGYIYTYGWCVLLCSRKQDNIVKQLSKKINFKKSWNFRLKRSKRVSVPVIYIQRCSELPTLNLLELYYANYRETGS